MPAIRAPATILVTGANGFIAMWITKYLLDKGYSVRGTVRNKEKAAYATTLFNDAITAQRLEYFAVPDFLATGAFDEVIKGVDAVVHTATPVTLKIDDPEGELHIYSHCIRIEHNNWSLPRRIDSTFRPGHDIYLGISAQA